MPDPKDTMRGVDAALNPRRTLKRREEEAEDQPRGRPLMDRAEEESGKGGVKFTTGPRKLTPEQQAASDAKLRELLRKRGG